MGDFYEHVVFRHLDVERDDNLIDKLEIFLKESIGNKYGISSSKILFTKRESIKPKKGAYIDEDRTFFCSELVAKAYKVLEIMGDDKPSSAFYPGSFSAKGDVKLLPHASLGPEHIISVDKNDIKDSDEDSNK